MRFLVFGAGSIGSAFGGFLSTKHDVILLGRKWHIDPIRERGLRVSGIWGQHRFRRFAGLYDSEHRLIRECPETDCILLTTKANDTRHAAEVIATIAGPGTLVVSLQNGLGNVEHLRRHFPDENILAGRVIFGVVLNRGSIEITVSADDTLVGEVGKRRGLRKSRRLVSAFEECGLKARAVRDIDRHIWSKVIYNCALNPLASLLDVAYGELLDSQETRVLMRKIVEEIYTVAGKMKIKLSPPTSRGYVRLLFGKLIPLTAAHHPSMLQAIRRKKPTEIGALNAVIVDYGRDVKVVTPVNSLISALVRAKERLSGCIPF